MKAYYDQERKLVEYRTHPLPSMLEMPKEDGKYVLDADFVQVLEIEVDGETIKQVLVDPTKKQAKLDAILLKEQELEAKKLEKEEKKEKVKGLKMSDLKTEEDMKQAIIDILDYLELG